MLEIKHNVWTTGFSTQFGESTITSSVLLPNGYLVKLGAIAALGTFTAAVATEVVKHYWIGGEKKKKKGDGDEAETVALPRVDLHIRGEEQIRKYHKPLDDTVRVLDARKEAKEMAAMNQSEDGVTATIEVGTKGASVEVKQKEKKEKPKDKKEKKEKPKDKKD